MRITSESILPVRGHDHIQGSLDAPYVLVEYGDYQCPYCAEAHEVIREIQQGLGKKLCFAYRHFPLMEKHPNAEHAAEAAEAAAELGRFWEMHDLLYNNQDALEDEDLAQYAADLNIDARRLMAEVQGRAHASRIQKDLRSGEKHGVNGTPTFFVNGKLFDGEPIPDNLIAALTGRAE